MVYVEMSKCLIMPVPMMPLFTNYYDDKPKFS